MVIRFDARTAAMDATAQRALDHLGPNDEVELRHSGVAVRARVVWSDHCGSLVVKVIDGSDLRASGGFGDTVTVDETNVFSCRRKAS